MHLPVINHLLGRFSPRGLGGGGRGAEASRNMVPTQRNVTEFPYSLLPQTSALRPVMTFSSVSPRRASGRVCQRAPPVRVVVAGINIPFSLSLSISKIFCLHLGVSDEEISMVSGKSRLAIYISGLF